MIKEVLVVNREKLFEKGDLQGFLNIEERNLISGILKNYEYKERNEELENNEEFLQVIPYVWVVNPQTKKVFLYKRAPSSGEYKETRHLNYFSCGVGGHIDRDTEENSDDPIMNAAIRELEEETVMENYPKPKIVGFINDDSNIFNKVHLGVVAIAETTEDVQAADGMAHGKFYSGEDLEKEFESSESEVENWTRHSWPFVKAYLAGL
jgi:predicted NUDIX family phosphoesterase